MIDTGSSVDSLLVLDAAPTTLHFTMWKARFSLQALYQLACVTLHGANNSGVYQYIWGFIEQSKLTAYVHSVGVTLV